ncbi:MAG: trigger factor [Oscillospiraceae bacterium]|nr:trigger factor [Oscillospiraceae bacterium]
MSFNVERKEHNLAEFTITVEREVFEDALNKAYRRNAGRIRVPGFRAGKAPRKIIEKMYGSGFFYEDAVDMSFPKAYEQAVEESELETVERPDVKITEIGEDGYTFTANVHIRPEVTLGEYKGISAEKKAAVCTDEDIQADIERLLTRNARIETSEHPLENGDTIVMDFEGFVDGEAFEGGKGENYNLVIGSGRFIPGFEEQLIGKKTGESLDVSVTFPEKYHAENLAGKEAVFKVTVNETKMTVKPELDDEFVKDVSEFDTMDEFKEDVRKRILETRESEVESDFETAVIDKLLESFEAEIPEVMIEERLVSIMQDFGYRMSMQGIDVERYAQLTGMDIDTMREQQRPSAERQVKCDLAFRKVAELEGIEISDDEMNEEYAKLSESYRMDLEEVRRAIPEKTMKRDMMVMKGSKLVMDNAVVAAPAKKTKAPAKPKAEPKTDTKTEVKTNTEVKPKTTRKKKEASNNESGTDSN